MIPDYEDMILARQEMTEILEDECSGDCDYCPWARSEEPEYFYQEPHRWCGLYEEG